jgi:hypothetical protein
MDVQESQSNWPEMRKTLGKPLVLQRRGQEPNFLLLEVDYPTFRPTAEILVSRVSHRLAVASDLIRQPANAQMRF